MEPKNWLRGTRNEIRHAELKYMQINQARPKHRIRKYIRIYHRRTGELLVDGPLGWGITPFEGNYYIRKEFLRTEGFNYSFIPGFCFYKFIYVWLNFKAKDGVKDRMLGWKYIIPNPLLPFMMFRVALSGNHPLLNVIRYKVAEPLP